jgi:predicted alpha-1,2-mannosidase
MKKRNLLLWLSILGLTTAGIAATPPVKLANPMQGTDSTSAYSHGNEYPAIALPFPMNTWAPYTQVESDSFYYQYPQKKIRGIRQTHQPSPWIGDYAAFALMPVSGKLALNENDRASEFQHENEIAEPSYYSVRLDTWKATAEVTPTERAARFRFTFDGDGDAYVVLDAFSGGSAVEIVPSENKVMGVCRNNRGGVPKDFGNYFVVIFDQPFEAQGVWSPEGVRAGELKLDNKHAGAYFKFKTGANRVITCKVASSFISPAQAMLNLKQEIGDADFQAIRVRAEERWNEALGRARVEGGTDDQKRTFYSALYRSIVYPHKFYEMDEQGHKVYYSPYDGKVHEGVLYTDTGFWDTFRAAHPLYNLLYPEVSAEILQGLLNAYDQSGWLPSWSSPGHRDCMIGNHAFSLFADGWAKGIRSFDSKKAVDAMVHDANAEGPINTLGRKGVKFYNTIGYVPSPNIREAAAQTLEFAYDDFCAAQLARAIGRNSEADVFAKKAMNYTNLFDAKIGFVRGRQENGAWCEPFDPTEWGGPFTEGCSWHWTWSVFQDIPGLINLMGGEKAFADKLDAVFTAPNTFKWGSYGFAIHEMTEMAALDMGQYAHGNEPIHHMIYLYDYVGQPWRTQSRVRTVMTRLYQATPDGLCGDEDTGQTSAWYVLSALGFYPVTPGTTTYAIGSPLFNRATLSLTDGRKFTIVARENGPQHAYIRGAQLNGAAYDKVFLEHQTLLNGGEIVFQMSSAPDYKWGSAPENRPPAVRPAQGK